MKMKSFNVRPTKRVRRFAATTFACVVVIIVPLLSINQYGHFFHIQPESRQVSALPAFQIRPIDSNKTPYHLFKEPLISVTFDDGWETTYKDAMPVLNKYGVHTTQYIISGIEDNQNYLSWEQIKAIQKAGHEIGCHTESHADLRLLSDQNIMKELTTCKEKVKKHVGGVRNFSSPYGSADARTLADIRKVFKSQRNTNGDASNGVTDADINLASDFDRFNIISMTVKRTTTFEEIQKLVDFTEQNNGWLVLTFHQADDGNSKYGIDTKSLSRQMEILNHSKARIVTVDQALVSLKDK